LKRGAGWVTKHEDIENTIHAHFAMSMKKGPTRSRDFNWDNIPLPECDLSSLAEDFTEGEVHEAVKALPFDKAPGPDGFMGLFFKFCWATIKEDLMRVICLLFDGAQLTREIILLCSPAMAPEKLVDGAVIMMPESLIAFVDEVNDRPVGKPQEQGLMNIAASFSLSYETKV
jgi:hypothetical protein